MVCWGRRFGFAGASIFAAILIFASPVIGKDGISAYNDLAVATLIYAVFYLLQVWDESNQANLLIADWLTIRRRVRRRNTPPS